MGATMLVKHYFDYKSPYAYLAQEANWKLAEESGVEVEWIPYTLQIPKYLGAAKLDTTGQDTLGTRNDHQWRRVRYSYMDCRREATRRGLVVRGPRHIFDSSLAHSAFLWVAGHGDFRAFHDYVFEKFWRRELDIEDLEVLLATLSQLGLPSDGFVEYAETVGRQAHDQAQLDAEAAGVFGVPSWLVGEELFWGLERLPHVYELLVRMSKTNPA